MEVLTLQSSGLLTSTGLENTYKYNPAQLVAAAKFFGLVPPDVVSGQVSLMSIAMGLQVMPYNIMHSTVCLRCARLAVKGFVPQWCNEPGHLQVQVGEQGLEVCVCT